MESRSPFYAYKETRLDLDPSIQHSTVAIRVPQLGASTWSTSRTAPKRSQILELPVAEDEDTFRQRHLATAASVYHRQYHRSPRSFLWRVLEGGKVLSIRVVDVSRDKNAPDSNLTLRFYFQNPIMPCGVAFSDSREHDVLSAFVMTDNYQLHTLSLRPDYFRKTSSTEGNVGDWCKSYLSPAFGFKKAHRLVALNSDEVMVSLIDGGLLKLAKKPGGDGLEWKEIHYNEGGWSDSFRNLVPFRRGNTIQYGKHTLEISSAASIASPATLLDGAPYAFTVSLDHRLRVWNLATGKIAYIGDLLNHEMDPNEAVKKVIDPSLSQLVKVYGGDESAICVTYSPLGTGQFKFWNFIPKIDGSLEATDLFPHNALEPRAPTSDLWTMADFSVVVDSSGPNTFTLWTMWKNNTTYRIQTLDFASDTDSRTIRGMWTDDWKAMATETLRETPVPTSFPGDSSDITDKYLEYILFPGKYTTATIETGLALYEHKSRGSKDSHRRSGSLPERLCSVIASSHSLGRTSDGGMDYDQLRLATEDQWRRFCRLLSELDKLRGEAQSLVIDPEGNMPWVILADGLTAIRECSKLERIIHNPQAVSGDTELIALPLIAASEFRESFSDQFLHSCKVMLLGELFEDPSLTDPARMLDFYNKCDFANQIGDEDYQSLVKNLGGGFKNITTEVCDVILNLLRVARGGRPDPIHPLCEYGNKLIVKGVQEIVELHHNICLDQLILLVLIEGEINHGEDGIKFETGAVYSQLLTILRTLELLRWLTSTRISVPLGKTDRSSSENEKSSKQPLPSRIVTVFEALLHNIITLDLRKQTQESMPPAVTEILLRICTPDGNYEQTTSLIQCLLLRLERPDLAMDLQRFTARDAYSVYIQGRVCLAYDDPQTAAVLFKKAAFGMSDPSPKIPMLKDSGSFLNEIERSCLNAGLPEYYSHIVSLYEKEKLFSFVVDFARLALQFVRVSSEKPQHHQLRTEMHSRLFTAAVQTSRFDLAHSTLSLFTDHAIQRSSLRSLIMKMCETSYATQLIQLPFIGLQDEVDEILAQKCQSIIDVTVGVPYHKILYAWRIKRNDFRGAAAISLERLQRLQQSGDGDRVTGDDGLETPITKQYVTLINALSCVDPKQAWILCEEPVRKEVRKNGAQPKRKVVTLEDIRKDYQGELDRIAAIENNQFAFAPVDEMDVL